MLRYRSAARMLGVGLSLVVVATLLAAYNWPQFNGSGQHTGANTQERLITRATRLGDDLTARTVPADQAAHLPGAVAEFSAALAPQGWSVAVAESPGGAAQPLWLRIDGDLTRQVDAWEALQALRGARDLSADAAEVVTSLSLARLSFIGTPAKAGQAGPAREPQSPRSRSRGS